MEVRKIFINGANSTSAKCLIKNLAHTTIFGLAARKPEVLIEGLNQRIQDFEEAERALILRPEKSKDFPHGLSVFQRDATQFEQINDALQVFSEHNKPGLQGYAHFPGSVLLKPAHMTKIEEWDEVIRVNLTSAFFGLKAAVNIMRKETVGRLVFISSVAAQRGLPAHEAISAAKAGIEALVRSAAASYPMLGINCVAPGLIDAKATQKIIQSEGSLEASLSLCAIKRPGTGADIASAAEFLLSSKSSYMTGQVVSVDGGMSTLGFPRSDSRPRPATQASS